MPDEHENPRARVLVIGAGRRIQNNFLPVLRYLSDELEIVGVHSRTESRLRAVTERWGLPAIVRFEDIDFSAVDLVALSLPTAQNAVVLRKLLPYADRLRVLIDTPIVANFTELAACAPLLERFQAVFVTEDYMSRPPFSMLRQAVSAGLIGRLESATLYNVGYSYHGLALIRSFVDFRPYTSAWHQKISKTASAVGYRFSTGFEAAVIGPYRRHSTGGMVLEGSAGVITEFAWDCANKPAGDKPYYLIDEVREGELLSGYRLVNGAETAATESMPEIAAMRSMPFDDKSDINLLRGCGLIAVFRAALGFENASRSYDYKNALYDSVVSRLSARGFLPGVDPFTFVGSDLVSIVRRLIPLVPKR